MQHTAEIVRYLSSDPGADLSGASTLSTDTAASVRKTHISIIVLAGPHAYKLKRAVRLPYLDFSSVHQRLATCQRELELNRRTAPGLYLAVRRITLGPDNSLEFDGKGELIDAVVQMRRFAGDDVLDSMAERGQLTRPLMTQLAQLLAQFHASAAPSTDTSGAARMADVLDINQQSQEATAHTLGSDRPIRLNMLLHQTLMQHSAILDARAQAGKVRLCHGDLHLGNICLWDGQPTPFDCLEFSDSMATTDVLYDLAFLLMDLWRYREYALANIVMNRYMDETADISGLPVLPFFMALRAAIRTQILATQAATANERNAQPLIARASRFLDIAFDILQPRQPQLIAIGGFSGTGKSTLASALAPSIGAVPGARILSSDRIRKRLSGVSAETTLPASSYTRESSDRVYQEQRQRSGEVLATRHAVIADAVFSQPTERTAIEACALQLQAAFTGIWLQAPTTTLITRVQKRKNDPSDATADVVRKQLQRDPGNMAWHVVHTDRDPDVITEQVKIITNHLKT